MKARITVTGTLEVELKPENYTSDITTDEERLAFEIAEMSNDPDIFWEIFDGQAVGPLKVTGELVK